MGAGFVFPASAGPLPQAPGWTAPRTAARRQAEPGSQIYKAPGAGDHWGTTDPRQGSGWGCFPLASPPGAKVHRRHSRPGSRAA